MENSEEIQPKLFLRPIFIIGNLLIAVFLALFFSTADNLSVRGGGFAIYADPSQGGTGVDANGNPIQGDSSIIARGTPTPTSESTAEDGAIDAENQADASQDSGEDVERATEVIAQPTPTACVKATNWQVAHTVQRNETLHSIALRIGLTWPEIQAANCLPSDKILAGDTILLPQAVPTQVTGSSSGAAACGGAPSDWLYYTIQGGDTVYSLAEDSGITREELVRFNCLRSEIDIQRGDQILLPPNSPYHRDQAVVQPTSTPQPIPATNTPAPAPTATPTLAPTNTIEAPQDTPTPTEMPDRPEEIGETATATATSVPVTVIAITPENPITETPTVIPPTNTPEPTATQPLPTETPTTELPTITPEPIATTIVPTNTSEPTQTPTVMVNTPVPAQTEVSPIETPTSVPTEALTSTATLASPSSTPEPTPIPSTETPTLVPTVDA